MPPRLRRQMDALRSQTERLAVARRPGARPRAAHHAGPGLPRRRADPLHLHRQGRRAHRPLGRAAPAGVAGPALVPRRLRPRPPGLALLPRRPDQRAAHHRPEVPAARAARRGRALLRPGRHPPDAAAVRRPRGPRRRPDGRRGGRRPLGDGRPGRPGDCRPGDERRHARLADDRARATSTPTSPSSPRRSWPRRSRGWVPGSLDAKRSREVRSLGDGVGQTEARYRMGYQVSTRQRSTHAGVTRVP